MEYQYALGFCFCICCIILITYLHNGQGKKAICSELFALSLAKTKEQSFQ